MVDRFSLWLGAGVVAAGVTVGMLAGAGTAHAQTESGSDDGAKTSQPAKPADNKPDSDKDKVGQDQRPNQHVNDDKIDNDPAVGRCGPDAKVDRDSVKDDVTEERGRKTPRSEVGNRTAKLINNVVVAVTQKPARKAVVEKAEPVREGGPGRDDRPRRRRRNRIDHHKARRSGTAQGRTPADTGDRADLLEIREGAAHGNGHHAGDADAVGERRLGGSTDSGAADGQRDRNRGIRPDLIRGERASKDLRWSRREAMSPSSGPRWTSATATSCPRTGTSRNPRKAATPPEHIIYLQHGFLARGVFYDYTAAYLAEQTNSVVVAPSLTSNIFATDGMWLGGDQMHRAVADLFLDGNAALLKSAQAAGYPEGKELPKEVVLVGHSLGGGLVIDTARFMAADEADDRSNYELAGVLMLDGVSFTDPGADSASDSPGHPGVQPLGDALLLESVRHHGCRSRPGTWRRLPRGTVARWPALGLDDRRQPAGPVRGLPAHRLLAADQRRGLSDPCRRVDQRHVRMRGNPAVAIPDPDLYAEPGETITIPTRFGSPSGWSNPRRASSTPWPVS